MTVERVRVGEVLKLDRLPVEPDPTVEYVAIGVRSFGKGIFHYEPKLGDQLGSLRFFEVEANRLVVSNIKGWEGAIAVSSESDAGCIASNRFLLYVPIDAHIDVQWARWYFLSEPGIEQIQRASPGSADRNRTLAISRFEALEIPLPPIDEQRRVAGHLVARTERARMIADAFGRARPGRESLMAAARHSVFSSTSMSHRRLEEVALIEMGQSPPGGTYNETGEGLPLLNGPTEFGTDIPTPRQWTAVVTKIAEPGDLLICVRGATTGRINWADQRYCIGRGLAAIRPDPQLLDAAYLRHALLDLAPEIMLRTAGSTFANLPGKQLMQLSLPVPALATQKRLADLLANVEHAFQGIMQRARRSRSLLAALEPSLLNEAFAWLS